MFCQRQYQLCLLSDFLMFFFLAVQYRKYNTREVLQQIHMLTAKPFIICVGQSLNWSIIVKVILPPFPQASSLLLTTTKMPQILYEILICFARSVLGINVQWTIGIFIFYLLFNRGKSTTELPTRKNTITMYSLFEWAYLCVCVCCVVYCTSGSVLFKTTFLLAEDSKVPTLHIFHK